MFLGFQITQKIHETERSVVYRALRSSDSCPVMLKVLNTQYPTPRELARYRQEYEILGYLNAPGVPGVPGVIEAYSLEKRKNTTFLVLEDFGAASLSTSFEEQPPMIERFLDLAIQASAALGHIHQRGVIHKDINPSNIVWNSSSNQLKIIDFGVATRLSTESPTLKDPKVIEGTLAYISPEQTGRMNRRLDYRTDFYSLGVTFYELLTGHLPFEKQDALELVHAHIAARPRPPIELRDDIPPMLSRIIMHLLAKTAEERYQSAWGLKADLEACRALLPGQRRSSVLPLSCEGISDRFEIPQTLYGRGHDTDALLQAFERVGQGPSEIVLITGYSGIGKTSLVRELYKPITKNHAFFITGKFDMLQRAMPYRTIAVAFSQLVRQLLTGTREELLGWQEQLTSALGPNARIMTDLIPDLELVIGPQAEVEALDPTEAKNRLHLAFASFTRVFCKPSHPLVVFLDDLQWADPAALSLLEPLLVEEDIGQLLLIGAYRDDEVNAVHPLSTVLQRLDEKHASISNIHLLPLSLEDITHLLADTLHRPRASLGALAGLVRHRTGGNPFFVNQFLRMLHEEGFLRFDAALPGWRWDMAEIQSTMITENVAGLLSAKLRKLPESMLSSLRLAACMGSCFDLDTITMITDQPERETFAMLLEAVREGYIHPTSEPELVTPEGPEGPDAQLVIREYKFVHDRVQQAAYALIPAEQLAAIHLGIGRLLLAKLSAAAREERLLELVDHLNLGRALLRDAPEHDPLTTVELARLNLAAGKKAKEATAYGAAARYLAVGLELAGEAWDEHHDLALSLHVEGAHAEHCHGDFERSQALIDTALARETSAVSKARLHQISIIQYTNQARHEEAFRVAREALLLLGQAFPRAGEMAAAAARELADITQILGDRAIDSLIDAPAMTVDTHRAAIEILSRLAPSAFQTDAKTFDFVSARMVRLSLEHGHTVAGAHGFALYAMVLVRFRDYQRAYEFGQLSMRLADRLGSAAAKCKTGEVVIAHIHHWAQPLRSADPINAAAFEAGLQSGELQYAGFTLMYRLVNHFYRGDDLQRIESEARSYLQLSKHNKNSAVTNTFEGFRIAVAHLTSARAGDNDRRGAASSASDAEHIARCHEEACFFALGVYYVLKCQVLYVLREYDQALQAAIEGEKLLDYIPGLISEAALCFYHSLCLCALFEDSTPEQQAERWRTLESHQEQMRVWMEHCPENFGHMYLLVAAEMARITGDDFTAVQRYAQAIEAADENELRQDLALANELAARFWLAKGMSPYAMFHMRDAHYGYSLWGATGKAAMLEAHHAGLRMRPWGSGPHRREINATVNHPAASSNPDEQLDLASVIKASQALSGEIALDKLLARLIGIVIENAGAQHGFLLLKRKDQLVIEAMGTLDERDVQVLQSLPLERMREQRALLSTAIVNYVLRSKETVVLHDAAQEGPFVGDPYVVTNKPRSILCMPLVNQGQVNGVVYLENNLSPYAFTPERVALLNILATQMTISLDNSLLYSNLQQASQDLERLLHSIAHDLKEPLRAIQSFSELLARRYEADIDMKGRDYLARIVNAGQRLGLLLDGIRMISEIRRSERPRTTMTGELLIQEVMGRLRAVIDRTQGLVRIAADLPELTVDRRWAAEAVYQLIRNALQYTREGMSPDIEIAPYQGSDGVGLVIMDRGPGIPDGYEEKAFELFRRIVGREIQGTGAGLAIVRQVAMKHGGNVWLCPRAGGGTEAYITFGQ